MKKSTIRIICIILGVVILGGVIAFSTGLFKVDEDRTDEVFGKKLNEDNLYTVECKTLEDSNDGYGVIIDVDEKKGGIKLDGTASKDMTFVVGKVALKEGTYTLTACEQASMNGIYVTASYASVTHNFDFTPNQMTLENDTEVTITIHIAEGTKLNNVWVLPVIVEGTEAGSYYA